MIRGYLLEYKNKKQIPLALEFEFNPKDLTFARKVNVGQGKNSPNAYSFNSPEQASVAAWDISSDPVTFSIKILLDCTYRFNDPDKDVAAVAVAYGIQPELDLLSLMSTFGSGGKKGHRALAAAGGSSAKSFMHHKSAPVLLFCWGEVVLPVFITNCSVNLTAFMPSLTPMRAEATLNLKVIEGNNPFYLAEELRQVACAAMHTHKTSMTNILKGKY